MRDGARSDSNVKQPAIMSLPRSIVLWVERKPNHHACAERLIASLPLPIRDMPSVLAAPRADTAASIASPHPTSGTSIRPSGGTGCAVVRVIWSKRSGFIFAGGTGPSPSVIYPTAQPVLVSREKHRSGSSDFSARAREAHHCGGSGGECGANASFSFDVERTT